jgi:hypothetical protein
MKKADDEVIKAIANFAGSVTRCPPGRAQEWAVRPAPDVAAQWLSKRRDDLSAKNPNAERKKARAERLWSERIRERNAAVLKRIAKQERRGG